MSTGLSEAIIVASFVQAHRINTLVGNSFKCQHPHRLYATLVFSFSHHGHGTAIAPESPRWLTLHTRADSVLGVLKHLHHSLTVRHYFLLNRSTCLLESTEKNQVEYRMQRE